MSFVVSVDPSVAVRLVALDSRHRDLISSETGVGDRDRSPLITTDGARDGIDVTPGRRSDPEPAPQHWTACAAAIVIDSSASEAAEMNALAPGSATYGRLTPVPAS